MKAQIRRTQTRMMKKVRLFESILNLVAFNHDSLLLHSNERPLQKRKSTRMGQLYSLSLLINTYDDKISQPT